MLAFLGLGSCLLLGRKAIQSTKFLGAFLASVAIPFCAVGTGLVLVGLIQFQPQVYDFYLYRFDGALGGQASGFVGRYFKDWPIFKLVCMICYQALPLVQSLLAASFFRAGRSPRNFFISAGLAGLAGCALYQVIPVIGPAHVFGQSFVNETYRSVPLTTTLGAAMIPRNGLPSLHFTWALLVVWNINPIQRVRYTLASLFLAATILATLGSGEHYLIDLVVAVPFTLSVHKGCLRQWKETSFYAAITLLWVIYLRFAMASVEPSRLGAWLTTGVTVLSPAVWRLLALAASFSKRMVCQQEFPAACKHNIQLQRDG
jgi:PAP2 superfamily